MYILQNFLSVTLTKANSFNPVDIAGYLAALFVLVSFIPKKEILIRLINMIGGVLFIIQGSIMLSMRTQENPNLGFIPLVLMNSILIIIHIVYISLYFVNRKKQKTVVNNDLNLDKVLCIDENQNNLEEIKKQVSDLIMLKNDEIKKLNAEIEKINKIIKKEEN